MSVSFREVVSLLHQAGQLVEAPAVEPELRTVTTDSRAVVPGALFIAVAGTQADGHRFLSDAAKRGAAAVVVERRGELSVPQIVVADGRSAALVIGRAWYGDPAHSLRLTGVTGTNGKTTTTSLLRHLCNADGTGGSVGTLGAFDGQGNQVPSTAGSLTTPGAVDLQATLAAMRNRGVQTVAMETSSHSLDQGRLDGLNFAAAVFTNLTRDHLDYHHTMEEYLAAKLKLLDYLEPRGVAALNLDDRAWDVVGNRVRTVTYGVHADADLRAQGLVLDAKGCRFRITGRYGTAEVSLPLPGDFNVSNALAAAAGVVGMGHPLDEVAERLATAPQVPGRMERIAEHPCVILRDYAHTPDSLERALLALRPLTAGRLIALFGCGGDRDRGKRPLMGRVAAELADVVVVTSDNPRTEDPERIIDDVMPGVGSRPHVRIADRREAIRLAITQARAGDTLLLAGKGHETYQVVDHEYLPFDERQIVHEVIGSLGISA